MYTDGSPDNSLHSLIAKLRGFLDQKQGDDAVSMLSGMTTYEDDDKEVWRELRRDLIGSGLRSSDIRKYSHELKDYLHNLRREKDGVLFTPREQTFRTYAQPEPTNIQPENSNSPEGLPRINENADWSYHTSEVGDRYIRRGQNGHDDDAWSSMATYGPVNDSWSSAATVRTRDWLQTQESRSQDPTHISDNAKNTNREPRHPPKSHPNRPDTRRSLPIPPPKEALKPEGPAEYYNYNVPYPQAYMPPPYQYFHSPHPPGPFPFPQYPLPNPYYSFGPGVGVDYYQHTPNPNIYPGAPPEGYTHANAFPGVNTTTPAFPNNTPFVESMVPPFPNPQYYQPRQPAPPITEYQQRPPSSTSFPGEQVGEGGLPIWEDPQTQTPQTTQELSPDETLLPKNQRLQIEWKSLQKWELLATIEFESRLCVLPEGWVRRSYRNHVFYLDTYAQGKEKRCFWLPPTEEDDSVYELPGWEKISNTFGRISWLHRDSQVVSYSFPGDCNQFKYTASGDLYVQQYGVRYESKNDFRDLKLNDIGVSCQLTHQVWKAGGSTHQVWNNGLGCQNQISGKKDPRTVDLMGTVHGNLSSNYKKATVEDVPDDCDLTTG
ncbi:hypothetical protein N7457_006977 [Penicillium paradoxum]|uniref:uncharacterized protein n=1 Tax=Penicillium paradoxum TaxID=176176 RepID=UPI00254826C9|nr:uncharacterized protein N7457_006977 [Penicillium paradoxum]KAJ5779257.1 hypothetical protein N7457_006977 [Penicillium paradoxum]